MAFRLDDLVVAGFFKNSRRFSTHGRLLLRGAEMPVVFELTGSPSPDLCGRTLEFEVPANDRVPSDEDRRLVAAFRPHQVGVTGEMTMARKGRTFDCSFEEFYQRSKLGEPPPTRWEPCLHLEWYSQNGRVVIELPVSKIHFLSEAEITARDQAERQSFEAEMRQKKDESETQAGTPVGSDPQQESDEMTLFEENAISPTEDDEEEAYGLIPDDLDSELERRARRLDREIAGESPDAIKAMEEMELMDEMLEKGKPAPLQEFLKDLKLPLPANILTEEDAEQTLKLALTELALAGVAFHVCQHCSAGDAYRIFMEKVCKDSGFYRPLIGTMTGWLGAQGLIGNFSALERAPYLISTKLSPKSCASLVMSARSCWQMRAMDTPVRPARPVRPLRCV